MPIRTHGDHLIFYDSHDEIDGINLGAPTVNDAQFPEGLGYYENPRLSEYPDAETLRKSASPIHIAMPTYIPPGYHALGYFLIRSQSDQVSDTAAAFIEDGMTEVQSKFGTRPVGPDDAAITVFTTRRMPMRIAYPDNRSGRFVEQAGILQEPFVLTDVRGHPALLIRMVARSGPSLRDRRIPAEFLTWFDPLVEGWVSIHSSAPSGETRRLAEALNV